VAAAEAFTTAGEAERAIAQARQALAVCHATRSTRLARALHRTHTQMRDTWPTHPAVRELGDELRRSIGGDAARASGVGRGQAFLLARRAESRGIS
jgi:hypothetical protein